MKVAKKENFTLKPSDWGIKVNDDGRRMKIYIKLNKTESSQWSALKTAIVGKNGMSDGELAKVMLFRGLNGFIDDLNKAVEGMSEEERKEVLAEAEQGSEVNLTVPVLENEKPESSDE